MKIKIIDSEQFSKFVRNDLSHDAMVEVEKALIENGTADAVFHSLLFEYDTNQEVDALIGPEDEKDDIWEEREKKYDEIYKKTQDEGSKGINDFLTTKTIPIMRTLHLTKEEMTKVTERYEAINAAHDASLSLTDNLVNAYTQALPETTKEEATDVVKKLIYGCDTLTESYNEALADGFDAEKEIADLCAGMTTQQRYSFLVSALVAVQALNLDTFTSTTDMKGQMSKAVSEYLASKPEPTEDDCTEMQHVLAEAITNNTLILNGAEKAKELLDKAGNGAESVIDFTSEQYDDARYKAETALAAWIAFKCGELASVPEGATPESIGVGVAAAAEEAKIISDVAKGNKTVDIAVKCLKILGGVALACLIFLAILAGAVVMSGAIISGLVALFGDTLFACFLALAISIPLSLGFANLGVETGEKILVKAGKVYDVVVEKLRESIFPKIVETAKKIVAWIKSKLSGQGSSVNVEPSVAL